MSYRRTDNTPQIISEHKAKAQLAVRFMLEGVHKSSNSKTPKLTGQLRADVNKSVDQQGNVIQGKIRWGKHYAAYQERGYTSGKVRRYTTPGTGAHFAENAVMDVKKDARSYFRKAGL